MPHDLQSPSVPTLVIDGGAPVKEREKGRPQSQRVQSVERALDLLEIVAAAGGEATLTQISAGSGLNISTCHHLLATLIAKGYVAKLPGKRTYVLGSRILYLSSLCLKQVNLPQRSQRVLDALSARTGEAVQLAVLQGDELITVLRKEALHAVRVDAAALGKTSAAHATATGKAILAWLPETEIARIVAAKGLPSFTAHTITDLAALLEELRLVRRHGYAVDREEFQRGVICIGSAIRDYAGAVVGAVSVSIPSFRASEETLTRIREEVLAAVRSLSADLGEPTAALEQRAHSEHKQSLMA
jgi:IclR family acetate operon transcriptional repressor